MNYFYNRSSSIFFIASEYCVHPQDGITHLPNGRKMPQVYLIGWYGFRYSDDGGRTWSTNRYRVPIRLTQVDRENDWGGKQQMFWGISHPVAYGGSVYVPITKIKHYHQKEMEGWFLKSDNILTELDPEKIRSKNEEKSGDQNHTGSQRGHSVE